MAVPAKSARNFTPSVTAEPSPASVVEGDVKSRIVHSGVTAAEASDAGLDPIAFVALTRNVYAVPFSRPVIVLLVADAPTSTGVCAVAPM